MTDDRKNIKLNESDFDLLKACKPSGENWGRFLTESVLSSSTHYPGVHDDEPDRVTCNLCGRTAPNLDRLEAWPCASDGGE